VAQQNPASHARLRPIRAEANGLAARYDRDALMSKRPPPAAPLLPPGPLSDAATLVHGRPPLSDAAAADSDAVPARSSRTHHRVTRRVAVCLGVGFESDANAFTGVTSDISEGGLFVATHSLPPIGSEIDLKFSLPAGPELHTRGIVRWLRDTHEPDSAPPGMGVEFSALAEHELTLIRDFVDQREPAFFEG
jgi:uncharacterized protein (TIGR02266 family)